MVSRTLFIAPFTAVLTSATAIILLFLARSIISLFTLESVVLLEVREVLDLGLETGGGEACFDGLLLGQFRVLPQMHSHQSREW